MKNINIHFDIPAQSEKQAKAMCRAADRGLRAIFARNGNVVVVTDVSQEGNKYTANVSFTPPKGVDVSLFGMFKINGPAK